MPAGSASLEHPIAATRNGLERKTADDHFRFCFCRAVERLIEAVSEMLGSSGETFRQFPFLEDYAGAIDRAPDWSGGGTHLPLRALQEAAALSDDALLLFMAVGLVEEDARFGPLFESLQNLPWRRPTLGLLTALWRSHDDCKAVREDLRRLRELGLVQVINPEAPRLEWALEPTTVLWDALRGECPSTVAPWARFTTADDLLPRERLILSPAMAARLAAIPALLASGRLSSLVIRGPRHNGRRTLLGAIARELGRGLLEITTSLKPDEERLRIVGPLATALHALPVFEMALAPGETADLPRLHACDGPLGVVLERHGGLTGSAAEKTITLTLDTPGAHLRRDHWVASAGRIADPDTVASRFRLTSGNIRRAAALAESYALIEGRGSVESADVRDAVRLLSRQALETVAIHVPSSGGWEQIAAAEDTMTELHNLERRCRYREELRDEAGPSLGGNLNCGVRALFSGPSGTGKTMAARLLASALHLDLYRVDLASVVNKYIGETEKNLNQVFSRAEELDVILLLDEGDALMTARTGVQNANDRYANLETNFLLQRIEAFDGILLITTNAAGRIDSAFQRRMDVVVDFRAPEPRERWLIWQIHLPRGHQVEGAWLEQASARCALNGGQIRNAVLHASLLALENDQPVSTCHAEQGVRREYRKMGAVCPLRSAAPLAPR